MKRASILAALVALVCGTAKSQNQIITFTPDGVQSYDTAAPDNDLLDTSRFVVSYRMIYQIRPENDKPKEDLMLLEVGEKVSKFYSYKAWQTDSLVRVTPPEQVMDNLAAFHGGVRDVIFRDMTAGELTHTDRVGMNHFFYTEPVPVIDWELADGERTILGYVCRLARGTFRGRSYEAWYASGIPVSVGPWKFGGLPGLILSIRDDAGVLDIEATGIEQRQNPITKSKENYMKATRKKYMALKHQSMTDPVGFLTANSNVQMTIKSEDGTKLNASDLVRGYNPIELE